MRLFKSTCVTASWSCICLIMVKNHKLLCRILSLCLWGIEKSFSFHLSCSHAHFLDVEGVSQCWGPLWVFSWSRVQYRTFCWINARHSCYWGDAVRNVRLNSYTQLWYKSLWYNEVSKFQYLKLFSALTLNFLIIFYFYYFCVLNVFFFVLVCSEKISVMMSYWMI